MYEQDGPTELLDRLLETNPVGTLVFDGTGELWRANPRARQMVGLSPDEPYVTGERTLYDRDGDPLAYGDRPVVRALRGETVEDRVVGIDHDDGRRWFSMNARPLERDGTATHVVATMDDVTERVEQERRLREHRDDLLDELASVHDRMSDAVVGLDEEWRFTYLNEQATELLDVAADDLLGESLWETFPEATGTPFETAYREAMAGDEAVTVEEYYAPLDAWFEVRAYPAETGLFLYFHDVTERKERERELEEYERLAETHDDGLYVLDTDLRFRMVNEAYAELLGREREEVIGATVEEVAGPDVAEFTAERFEELVEDHTGRTVEVDLPTADGDTFLAEVRYAPLVEAGEVRGAVGTVRDVTEQKTRERKLERYETIVDTIWDGVYALDEDDRFVMANETFLDVTGYDREELLGRHASLVHAEPMNDEVTAKVEELRDSADADESTTLEHGVETADGEVVPVETRFGPYSHGDGYGRAGVVRDVSERERRERQLRQQRERLAAVNHLYELVRDLTGAVLEASSRADVANLVCERLNEADAYAGGWVAEYDTATGEVDSLCERCGSFPRPDLAVDAATAEELQVERADGRTYAAVPVSYDGSVYGAVVVYTDRDDALDADERTVLGHLGSVVGHVVAALDRKAALVSESVVEATFHSNAAVQPLVDAAGPFEGALVVERTVPSDGHYLGYIRPEGVDLDTAATALEGHDAVENVRRIDGDHDRIEMVIDDPPFIGTVASHGGRVDEVRMADNGATITAEFARGTDIRRVRDALRKRLPDVDVVSTRTATRSAELGPPDALERLTDRQQSVFETAYYGGYFEWPRGSTAEELADALGISAPTLHQHLRAVERKLLGAYLE